MVFIEEKRDFLNNLSDKPKQKALVTLIFDETFLFEKNNIPETDIIYYSSIQSIKKNSKDDFNKQYDKISQRKISEHSIAPFIHDDYLIFTLIIGVQKFDCNKDWLLQVISNRSKNEITTTFENLLKEDYQSKANIQSIVLIFLFLLDKSKITNKQLNEAYGSISNTNQSINNDFIRIVFYRAFDIILQLKELNNNDLIRLLEFESRFKKRINLISLLLYNLLLLFILIGLYKILYILPEKWRLKIDDIVWLLGILGIGGLVGNSLKEIKIGFKKLVFKFFGYKVNIK